MNCSLCGLPQDTGAMASVLPQCICHWKHTPYNIMEVKELNDGGEPVKNATYWKRQHDNLLMQLKTCAIKVSELEKKLDIRTRELIGASFYEHDYKTMMANNKPAAWLLIDEINGDYMLERHPSGDYDWIPLYTHPAKELHLSLQKEKETGELLAVTYTDDEHRIVEVLWQRPPVKELTYEDGIEECAQMAEAYAYMSPNFTALAEELRAILRKASEK